MKAKTNRKIMAPVLVFIPLMIFGASTINAAPGDLDSTFSSDGKLTDGVLSHGKAQAFGVAIQPDGKIVVAGTNGPDFAIARYNTDGSLDTTFGHGGQVTTPVGRANVVAIQPDGKIVVGGSTYSGSNSRFALIRYNADGSLDATFGTNGRVTTTVGSVSANIRSIAIHNDGRIVAAGYVENPATFDRSFAVARYNPDGALDATFDLDGMIITAVGNPLPGQSGSRSKAESVAIQPDGKIVIAGEAFSTGVGNVFALARYNLNGSLDTSFDLDGISMTSFEANASDGALSVAIQSDGKIVAAGHAANSGGTFAVARYDPDGTLDTTFDSDGRVITPIGITSAAYSIAVQPNGKIVAAGLAYEISHPDFDFAMVRYNANGSLDMAFDTDGVVTTPIDFNGGQDEGIYSVAIQQDGEIVCVGGSSTNRSDFIAARYRTDGSLDSTFDGDGILTTDFVYYADNALHDVVIQPNGKIVTAGAAQGSFAVARYNADGTRDTTFGGTGLVQEFYLPAADAVVNQGDGKIVAAGKYEDDNNIYYFALNRYNADGSRDASFNSGNPVETPLGTNAGPRSLVIQPDGKILAAGTSTNNFALVRYNANGSLDTSFDNDGIVTTSIGAFSCVNSIAIQPDGKVVAAGFSYDNTFSYFTTVRYNHNGSLDTSFDADGIVLTKMLSDDFAEDVAPQADGKIVVGGCTSTLYDFPCDNFALARYNPNGSLDTTFDSDGKVITPFGFNSNTQAYLRSVAIQPDGKIVGAGYSRVSADFDFTLVRYNPDGSPDTTFGGGDGKSTADFDHADDNAYGMALDQQGRAVVVGESDGRFAIARFLLAPNRALADFDGDGKADVSVFRSSDRVWYLNRSTGGFAATQFGLSTDKITPADFDGDSKTDIAVFRGGTWYWLNSSNGNFNAIQFGLASDVPVPADFTGDGRAELAVYRSGIWSWLDLSNNQVGSVQFGLPADKPVMADYDGDGRADQAVYRDGVWHLNRSSEGYTAVQFGLSTDKPVPADYDGDGKTDPAVYRNGIWYLLQSTNGFTAFQFGLPTDLPAPADYDGDGKTDVAVYRNGTWYLRQSTGGLFASQFGVANDQPIPAAFLP